MKASNARRVGQHNEREHVDCALNGNPDELEVDQSKPVGTDKRVEQTKKKEFECLINLQVKGVLWAIKLVRNPTGNENRKIQKKQLTIQLRITQVKTKMYIKAVEVNTTNRVWNKFSRLKNVTLN